MGIRPGWHHNLTTIPAVPPSPLGAEVSPVVRSASPSTELCKLSVPVDKRVKTDRSRERSTIPRSRRGTLSTFRPVIELSSVCLYRRGRGRATIALRMPHRKGGASGLMVSLWSRRAPGIEGHSFAATPSSPFPNLGRAGLWKPVVAGALPYLMPDIMRPIFSQVETKKMGQSLDIDVFLAWRSDRHHRRTYSPELKITSWTAAVGLIRFPSTVV
jgi:hypothetical protein